MSCFGHQSLSLILLLTALAGSAAFAPVNNIVTPSHTVGFGSSISRRAAAAAPPTITALHQSTEEDDDGPNTINIALISASAAAAAGYHDELQKVLAEHPFCKMAGVQLSIADVPTSSSWNKEHIGHLQQADIACFDTMSAVKSYLQNLDDHWNISDDMSDEDRRKLPNRLDIVGDILGEGGAPPAVPASAGETLMAVCPNTNTAKECLNSGRWMSNHIYYSKEIGKAVELKTEPIAGADNDDVGDSEAAEEEEEEIDVAIWADSVVQAAGDVLERKFWGGGW